MRPRRRVCLAVVLVIALLSGGLSRAQPKQAQRIKAAILLKLLTYDRLLTKRCSGAVVIALITDSRSDAQRSSLLSVFSTLTRHRVQARRIRVVSLHLVGRDAERLSKMLEAAGANLLFVAKDVRSETITRAAQQAKTRHLPMVSGKALPKQRGAALAIDIIDGKPRIFANLAAMREQRVSLPAAVLQLATVQR